MKGDRPCIDLPCSTIWCISPFVTLNQIHFDIKTDPNLLPFEGGGLQDIHPLRYARVHRTRGAPQQGPRERGGLVDLGNLALRDARRAATLRRQRPPQGDCSMTRNDLSD